MSEEEQTQQYEKGDARVLHVGRLLLKDGRIFPRCAVLVFPAGPPDLPFSVVWDGTPLTLSVKAATPPKP